MRGAVAVAFADPRARSGPFEAVHALSHSHSHTHNGCRKEVCM